jgi:DDE superfamily endonuclease
VFILRDLLRPLQAQFSDSRLGRERAHWFAFTLLAVIVPFTSSLTANLLRALQGLFGLDPGRRRFYAFMASPTLPWERLWTVLWRLIPEPWVDGRVLVALDDSLNNKTGRTIFGCGFFHDPTAKVNQPAYPWSQNIVAIGLLKIVKGRWCCLPLAFRFYFMHKDIQAQTPTTQQSGRTVAFQSKMHQAVAMLKTLAVTFAGTPILVVTDSWFGNDGLWRPLQDTAFDFHLLSRLRANTTLYDLPPERTSRQRGRVRKYGARLGAASDLAATCRPRACAVSVFLYGKPRQVLAYDRVVMLKNLKCQVRVVWVFRHNRWVAFFTTDLALSVVQIIEFYGARWKIEAYLQGDQAGYRQRQKPDPQRPRGDQSPEPLSDGDHPHLDLRRSHQGRSRTASHRQRSHQFRLLRCPTAHCQCRLERRIPQALAHPTQVAAKCFRLPPAPYGGLSVRPASWENFRETSVP